MNRAGRQAYAVYLVWEALGILLSSTNIWIWTQLLGMFSFIVDALFIDGIVEDGEQKVGPGKVVSSVPV